MALVGKVAIVTGASGGIGRVITDALLEQQVDVVAVDQVEPSHDRQGNAVEVIADVGEVDDVVRVGHRVRDGFGSADILVNAAGYLQAGPLMATDVGSWSRTLAVNTTGVFLMTRMVIEQMKESGRGGAIVTVASNAARVPRANLAAYSASKAAAAMLTRCVGLEVAGDGIRCNVVSPGSTDTDMLRASWGGEDRTDATLDGCGDDYRVGIPLRRIATPGDIADGVLFLLSDQARHITMHDLVIDGGASL